MVSLSLLCERRGYRRVEEAEHLIEGDAYYKNDALKEILKGCMVQVES